MVDLDALKKLILLSSSLDDAEKNSLVAIAPFMKDEDLKRLQQVLVVEQDVLQAMPNINQALDEGLKQGFQHTYKQFVGYKKHAFGVSEKKLHDRESQQAEDQIRKLNEP